MREREARAQNAHETAQLALSERRGAVEERRVMPGLALPDRDELQACERALECTERAVEFTARELQRATEARKKTEEDLRSYPIPQYLLKACRSGNVNIAVTGAAGVGKSSWINAIRKMKHKDSGAAKVGVVETTMEPVQYKFPGKHGMLRSSWRKIRSLAEKLPTCSFDRHLGEPVAALSDEVAESEAKGIQVGDRVVIGRSEPGYRGQHAEVLQRSGDNRFEVQLESGERLHLRRNQIQDVLAECVVWDLPGAGTRNFPQADYVRNMGVRHFDMVVLITATRFTEAEEKLVEELVHWNVPFFLVRNKIDDAVQSILDDEEVEEDDVGQTKEVTDRVVQEIVQDFQAKFPSQKIYLISTKPKHRATFDFQTLERDMAVALKHSRYINTDQECPICFERFAEYEGSAGQQLECHSCHYVVCSTCRDGWDQCPMCATEQVVELPVTEMD